jgi:hypothetical protein
MLDPFNSGATSDRIESRRRQAARPALMAARAAAGRHSLQFSANLILI